jgi:glycosyltransferase involved in cell wall biosynthesis
MDVSVVVPTHNRSRLLATTLRSVLRQRDVELEVIVVDEASTDDTPAMLAALPDARVRVVRHERPLGVSTARNRGAAEARGEWVAFLDDDDLWAPGKLVSQLDAARTAGRDWAYTGSVNFAEPFRVVHGVPPLPPEDVVAALARYNAIPGGGSNVIVRQSALLRAGPFDPRMCNTADWEMWIRLARAGSPAWVCSPLLAYRVHASNMSLDVADIVRCARLIEELHGLSIDWGRLHWWIAQLCVRQGRRGAAVREYVRAVSRGERRAGKELAALAHGALRRRRGKTKDGTLARSTDVHWEDQARSWITELRELELTVVDGHH